MTVILWQKPLCCLRSKLRVRTGSWALTPKGSKIQIFCVFNSADSTLNLYYKAQEKVDRCLLTGKVWALFWLALSGRGAAGIKAQMKKVQPCSLWSSLKKNKKHKVTHSWLCWSCNFPLDCSFLNDQNDGYNHISCSSHKNSSYWSSEQASFICQTNAVQFVSLVVQTMRVERDFFWILSKKQNTNKWRLIL